MRDKKCNGEALGEKDFFSQEAPVHSPLEEKCSSELKGTRQVASGVFVDEGVG